MGLAPEFHRGLGGQTLTSPCTLGFQYDKQLLAGIKDNHSMRLYYEAFEVSMKIEKVDFLV